MTQEETGNWDIAFFYVCCRLFGTYWLCTCVGGISHDVDIHSVQISTNSCPASSRAFIVRCGLWNSFVCPSSALSVTVLHIYLISIIRVIPSGFLSFLSSLSWYQCIYIVLHSIAFNPIRSMISLLHNLSACPSALLSFPVLVRTQPTSQCTSVFSLFPVFSLPTDTILCLTHPPIFDAPFTLIQMNNM